MDEIDDDIEEVVDHSPPWREAFGAWVSATLEAHGIAPAGGMTIHQERPWSTVLKIPTGAGLLYGKVTAPMLAFEPALTATLARWWPDYLPAVLAIQPDDRWMLQWDAGVPMRSLLQADHDLDHWKRVLPVYAELQQAMAPRTAELLELGLFDRRLGLLPDLVQAILDDLPMLHIDEPDGLAQDEHDQLVAALARIRQLADDLAEVGLPETLHHDDFHDANIYVREGRYTFADWGESAVAHPFFTLTVTLRSAAFTLDLTPDSREIAQLRDAYLEPWTRIVPRRQLDKAVGLADRLGRLNRALTWHHVLGQLPEAERAQHADAVAGWLQEFLIA